MPAQNKFLGFTLIELLVAVAIGAILTSVSLAAFRGYGDREQLRQAGSTLVTNLRSVQQKSLAGEKPAACDADDKLAGYKVSYVDESSYQIEAECLVGTPEAKAMTLPDRVTFSGCFSQFSFPVLKSGVSGAPVTISLTAGANTYQVTVDTSGLIRGEML